MVKDADAAIMLEHAYSKLTHLREIPIDEEHSQEIVLVQSAVREALACIEALPSSLDELANEAPVLSETAERFCGHAVQECIKARKADLEEKQASWMYNYIASAERDCQDQSMSAQQCQSWLEKTKNPPMYFSRTAIEEIERVRGIVETQMHKSRVERLLADYAELAEEEKSTFRRRLNEGG